MFSFGTGWMTLLGSKPASHQNTNLLSWLIFIMFITVGSWICQCLMFAKHLTSTIVFCFAVSFCDIVNTELGEMFVSISCVATSLPEYSNAEKVSDWI